jgi:hypothetical protein
VSDEPRRGAPPVTGTVQSCDRPVVGLRAAAPALSSGSRDEMNDTERPSGSHRGEPGVQLSCTNTRGAVRPSVLAIQMDGTRRLSARSTRETTYTTCAPSGEMRGSLANSNAK